MVGYPDIYIKLLKKVLPASMFFKRKPLDRDLYQKLLKTGNLKKSKKS